MARTEPNKMENDAAIAELKRETREHPPIKYSDATSGLFNSTISSAYKVVATEGSFNGGQRVTVALFPFDEFDGGNRRNAARIMAEELAERINEKA